MRDELHPEELLARATAGRLRDDEATDLKAHLARCPACALQLDLRADVDRALAPTAADYEIGARAVERLFAAGEPAVAAAGAVRGARRLGSRLAARAALIALTLVGTGVGAAAVVHRVRAGRFWGDAAPAESESPATRPARGTALGPRHAHEARVAAAEPSEEAPIPAAPSVPPPTLAPPAPALAPPPTPALAPTRALRATRLAPSAVARAGGDDDRAGTFDESAVPSVLPPPVVTPPVPAAPPAPAPPAPAPTASNETPRSIFQAAERARRTGDSTAADLLYAQLASDFPGSREEIAARVLRGQLLMDELGRTGEALASFDGYLRAQPRGALVEDARAGRAEALARLGRREEEAAAWKDLLSSHPRSLYAPRARKRLVELGHSGD